MISARLLKFFCTTALVFALSSTAQAEVDAKKVIDGLTTQFAYQGFSLSVESSELSGANIIAKGVSVKTDGLEVTKLGDVVLENVSEDGSGYIVGKVTAPASTYEMGSNKFEFSGATFKNMRIAAPNETDPVKQMILYESIDVGAMKVFTAGTEVFRVDGAKVTMTPYSVGSPLNFDASVFGLYSDLTKIPDPKAQEFAKSLGYKEISATMTSKGSWNPTDGRLTLTEGAYDFKDMGRLNITMDIKGYTPELLKSMQEMNKKLAGQDDSAKNMAALGLLQQISLVSVSVRFDDASLTGRLLDYFAKQQGQDKAAMIAQLKAQLPPMTGLIGDADFAAKVTKAISDFLDSPKSLEIKAVPTEQVPVLMLMGAGTASPQALIKLLNLTITANQ